MEYVFELSAQRRIVEANYNTYVNPILHPNRVMKQHDFLYILDGEWEITLENDVRRETYPIQKGDVVILPAQLHHYGTKLCSPNSRNMSISRLHCVTRSGLLVIFCTATAQADSAAIIAAAKAKMRKVRLGTGRSVRAARAARSARASGTGTASKVL